MTILQKFFKLSFNNKILFIEALWYLGFYRLLVLIFPFRKTARLLGEENTETPVSDEGVDITTAKRISTAVRVMSRHTFWESKCLVQAYAAKRMLRRRKQKATVYLGVSKNEQGNMIAHAWLRCGTIFVTGGNGQIKFSVTSRFSDVSKSERTTV
ncbi:MAG: lasso peptide biosynthesis B2 protein [Bacillota bacterium]|nr:lasso peptide biosynthesis B2 protein [Bacillota bacterium]